MKTLCIIESAYRATLEEQDEPVLWLVRAIRNAGADVAVLLRGNAVNYLSRGQDCSDLSIGGMRLAHPPRLDRDLAAASEQDIPIYAVREDLAERGLGDRELLGTRVARAELPALLEQYQQVWHW